MSKLLDLGSVRRETKGTHFNKNPDPSSNVVAGKYVLSGQSCKNDDQFTLYNTASDANSYKASEVIKCS